MRQPEQVFGGLIVFWSKNILPTYIWSTLRKNRRAEWKGSNRKQSARWQHISRLKAITFCVFGKINYGGWKHNSSYLGLVLPSGGWQSLIVDQGPVL